MSQTFLNPISRSCQSGKEGMLLSAKQKGAYNEILTNGIF